MSTISTHVLDTARGCPGGGLKVLLKKQAGPEFVDLASGTTNADGRVPGLVPEGESLDPGVYRMVFETAAYFKTLGVDGFYPYVEVTFTIAQSGDHFHVPLLLSPFGYSTYRGS